MLLVWLVNFCKIIYFGLNIPAISIAHNTIQHDQTKHIEVDRHCIPEKLDNGLIYMPYVSSQGNLQIFSQKDWIAKILNQLYPSSEWRIPIHQFDIVLEIVNSLYIWAFKSLCLFVFIFIAFRKLDLYLFKGQIPFSVLLLSYMIIIN